MRQAASSGGVVALHPLTAIGEVHPGDDLASLLAGATRAAGLAAERDDVLVVTQKIVSKAEGRFVRLSDITPGARARELAAVTRKDPALVELVLQESSEVLRAVPNVLITRHRTGHVMANAGIDRSNLGPEYAEEGVLLLPINADESAARLRAGLGAYWPDPPSILISDSFGRPWRMGVTNVAIGSAGLPALIDRRGDRDRDGRTLEVTQIAAGDMLAAAAGLVAGEGAEGVPAVLVRGWESDAAERRAAALVRSHEEDLFR